MFLNSEHKKQYERFLEMDRTHEQDRERKALFFILAGSKDLTSKGIENFYDFSEHMMKFHPEELQEVTGKFCSSSRALLHLAVNLYNDSYESLSFTDTFRNLDSENYRLALEAIKIRFEPETNSYRVFNVEAAEEDWRQAEEEDRINRGMAGGFYSALNKPIIEGEYE